MKGDDDDDIKRKKRKREEEEEKKVVEIYKFQSWNVQARAREPLPFPTDTWHTGGTGVAGIEGVAN